MTIGKELCTNFYKLCEQPVGAHDIPIYVRSMCLDAVSWSTLWHTTHTQRTLDVCWTSRTLPQVGKPLSCTLTSSNQEYSTSNRIAVFYTVVEHFETISKTFKTKWDERPSCRPRHKPWLTIGDNFIGFSSFCVTQTRPIDGNTFPEHCMVHGSDCQTSQPFFALLHARLHFETSASIPKRHVCELCIRDINF